MQQTVVSGYDKKSGHREATAKFEQIKLRNKR